MSDTSKHANDITFTEESLVGFIKKIHNNIRDNLMFASTSDMAEKAISFQKLKTQGIIGNNNKFTFDHYEYEQVPIDLTDTDYFYDQNEWEQIATPDPTTGEMNYYSRLKIYHIPTLFNEEQILNFYEQNPNQDLEYTTKDSPNDYYIVNPTEKYTSVSAPTITYGDTSTGHSAVIRFNVDKFYVITSSIYHSSYYKVLRNSEYIDCDQNTVYNENDVFILTASLTDAEKEVLQIFPMGSANSWDVTHAAQICIINTEYPLNDMNNGRYTWVRGGSLLEFKEEIENITDETTRPVGTIWIDENNGTKVHAIKVKGFDNSGNLDNSNANPAKGTNGTAFIASDILYAYKQLGTTDKPVPQAYITNLGSSNRPVNKAYIKDLYITDNGKIHGTPEFSGALTITDTTEATRIVPDSYVAQTPPDNYFNITNSGIRLTSTDQTYYVSLASGGYEAANTSTVYPSGTTFYTRSDNYSGGGNWAPPGGGYYYTVASPSTTVVNSSKIFKNNSYASQYYTKSGNTYTVCDTSTNYLNVQLYYGSGADPALGKNWSSSMALTGSIVTRGGIAAGKSIKGYRVHAAVFNDYAEYRQTNSAAPGRCVIEVGDGNMILSSTRLQPGANIVSDTFGFSIGETPLAQTPIAVCGRVLAYPAEDKEIYEPGDAVCSGPNGTISKMTREEIKEWPDRIVGYVSEIPIYEYWGSDKVEVNGRIWIKVR